MLAKAARGEPSPAEAVAEAESLINPNFDKWQAEGLWVGGARPPTQVLSVFFDH